MAGSIEKSSSVYRARAARARRIAEMLLGADASTVLAYAKECDDNADVLALMEMETGKPANLVERKIMLPVAA